MTDSPPATPGTLSPLHQVHVDAGASFTDFAGWQMPVRYTSDLAEHHAVRTAAGLFDLSHMGEIIVMGPEAAAALDYALSAKISAIAIGQAKYSLLLTREGGIVDDLVVYRTHENRFGIVVNASNRFEAAGALAARAAEFDATVVDESEQLALIAIQGPAALGILERVPGFELPTPVGELKYYWSVLGEYLGDEVLVGRTGYTGEDGFEIALPAERAATVWAALQAAGVAPCGLGARDTLRLEAGMNLYGQDMDESVSPLDAGLAWTVDLKDEHRLFVGRAALAVKPASRRVLGLILEDKGVLRAHMRVFTSAGEGETTSGSFSPTLEKSIAFARLPLEVEPGTSVEVDIRGKRLKARTVKLPFARNGQALV